MFWNKTKNKVLAVHPIIYIYAGVFVLIITLIVTNSNEVIKVINKDKEERQFFENLPLKARAVYVYDIKDNKVLYAKDEHTPLPLASITKVMLSYCALNNTDIEKMIPVPKTVFELGVGSTTPENFEVWKTKDLAIYTLVESSNLGALVLAQSTLGEEKTIECMNRTADEMELFETRFFNVSGLDIDIQRSGAYGSAENVAVMFENVYRKYPEILGATSHDIYDIYSQNGIIHTAQNTNIVSREIVGMLASKTGFTDLSGGNLVFMMNAGLQHKVVIVILGSTEEERFSDAIIISKAVLESFSK